VAWTNTSNDIMSGTPAVAEYGEYLAEMYPAILRAAAASAALQLQVAATVRVSGSPAWKHLESHVQVFAEDGDIVLGTPDPAWADEMRRIEYGTGEQPASPVLTTTLTSMIQPMGQTMQRVIDKWVT
jgi:hypothetical protein